MMEAMADERLNGVSQTPEQFQRMTKRHCAVSEFSSHLNRMFSHVCFCFHMSCNASQWKVRRCIEVYAARDSFSRTSCERPVALLPRSLPFHAASQRSSLDRSWTLAIMVKQKVKGTAIVNNAVYTHRRLSLHDRLRKGGRFCAF